HDTLNPLSMLPIASQFNIAADFFLAESNKKPAAASAASSRHSDAHIIRFNPYGGGGGGGGADGDLDFDYSVSEVMYIDSITKAPQFRLLAYALNSGQLSFVQRIAPSEVL